MSQHPNQPAVVNGIEKGSDVEIEQPVHRLPHQCLFQGRQGRMRTAPGTKPWLKPIRVGLVDGIQHFAYRALEDKIVQGGYAERPIAAVAFRDVCAAYRLWPVLPTVDPLVQRLEVARDADEFIRRFLIHVLPNGFHRIRHYGVFANGNRTGNIALARRLLGIPDPPPSSGDSGGTENPHHDSECPDFVQRTIPSPNARMHARILGN